jgi:hypothetical protein
MVEITKENFFEPYKSFKRTKVPWAGWTSYRILLGLLQFIENDLLKVVEYSCTISQTLETFNTTFIALIPKTNNPTQFESFRPISLYKCIYKIISKIIAHRLKGILSSHISLEQFGFLKEDRFMKLWE